MQVRSAKKKVVAVALLALLSLGAASCKSGSENNSNAAANRNAAVVLSTPTPAPAPSIPPDTALKNTIEANLTKAGVTGVTVEIAGGEVTLKGSIPRAKLQDAMKAANDAGPKKVNNQLVLK